jgi:hypothetical protein
VSSADRSKPDTRELAAYLQGEVTASEARAIDAALSADAGSRKRLDELKQVCDALSAPIPELERLDLAANVQAALAKPEPSSRKRGRLWVWTLSAAAALASVGALFLGVLPRAPADSEFRAKSGGIAADGSRRWAGIQIHRVSDTGKPERVSDRLTPRDGLVFSYTNLGPTPFDYLMIFAVDAHGKVYWFYPAYERHGTDPSAVTIEKSTSETRLPDVVNHDFARGPLSIYGLFARRPLRVSDVEAWLGEHGARIASAPPLAETSLHTVQVRVEP